MDHVSAEDAVTYFMALREQLFQRCDAETRQRKRLVKAAVVIDLAGASISQVMESRFREANSKASQQSGDLYPQLLFRVICVNPPSFMDWAYSLAQRVLPARLTKKVKVRSEGSTLGSSGFARRWLRAEEIPAFLGGGLPDDRMSAELTGELVEAKSSLTEVTVGARAEKIVRVTVPVAGAALSWSVTVASKDVKLSATLHPGTVKWVEWTDARGISHCGSTFRPTGSEDDGKEEGAAAELCTVMPEVTLDAVNGAMKGQFIVPSTGQVLMRFDNTYSYLTSKTVKYKFEVGREMAGVAESADIISQNIPLNL